MKFRPLHDRVLVKRLDEDEKSPGGIIIPDTAKEKPSEGKVVAVGSGTKVTSQNSSGITASTYSAGAHAHNFSGTTAAFNGASLSTGSGNSHENRPPYYALCYIMKT